MGKLLVLIGLAVAALGALMMIGVPLGRLPGDIVVRRGSFSFYFPLATSIVVSILLTLLLGRRVSIPRMSTVVKYQCPGACVGTTSMSADQIFCICSACRWLLNFPSSRSEFNTMQRFGAQAAPSTSMLS